MYIGEIAPVHITVIGVALDGYWIRDTPARSLPADEHHLHRKAMILGSYVSDSDIYVPSFILKTAIV